MIGKPKKNQIPFLNYQFDKNIIIKKNSEVITIDGRIIGTLGNFCVLTGKPKSRKSVFAGAILSSALLGASVLDITVKVPDQSEIIYIDTEQNNYNLSKSLDYIKISTGGSIDRLKVFQFRGLDTKVIIQYIEDIIIHFSKCKLIVIDGLLDLIDDFNSIVDAKLIVNKLMFWTENYNICIVGVLHQSKGNGYTIGHLGSFVDRKAESVLEVIKNEDDTTTLKPLLMRSDANFQDITIFYDTSIKNYRTNTSNIDNCTQIRAIIGNTEVSHTQLMDQIALAIPNKTDHYYRSRIKDAFLNNCIVQLPNKKYSAKL
jgi:hypothetical protein